MLIDRMGFLFSVVMDHVVQKFISFFLHKSQFKHVEVLYILNNVHANKILLHSNWTER